MAADQIMASSTLGPGARRDAPVDGLDLFAARKLTPDVLEARARGWPASDTSVEFQVRVLIRRDGPEVAREECWSHLTGDGMKTFLLSTTILLYGEVFLWVEFSTV